MIVCQSVALWACTVQESGIIINLNFINWMGVSKVNLFARVLNNFCPSRRTQNFDYRVSFPSSVCSCLSVCLSCLRWQDDLNAYECF